MFKRATYFDPALVGIARCLSFCMGSAFLLVMQGPQERSPLQAFSEAKRYIADEADFPSQNMDCLHYRFFEESIGNMLIRLTDRGSYAELQSYFLLTLDRYVTSRNTAFLREMNATLDRCITLAMEPEE
jgi:hypothetical protein